MENFEADLSTNFDSQMQTSRLMGNAEVLDKRNSKNAWVPTTWWLGGLMWHYYKISYFEFFHYKIYQID